MSEKPTLSKAQKGGFYLLTVASAQAGIVHVTPGDITLALDSSEGTKDYYWDIDSNGTNDFRFFVDTGDIQSSVKLQWELNSATSNNFVASNPGTVNQIGPRAVASGVDIGATLPTNYLFHNFSGNRVNLMATNWSLFTNKSHLYVLPYNGSYDSGSAQIRTVIMGFRFDIDGSTHYAWANIELALRDAYGSGSAAFLRIQDWAYEDTADTAIAAGAIPEPTSVAAGLGALALGVAGIRRMRKRKA